MAAIVASSSSVSHNTMSGSSMFDNGYRRGNTRQQSLLGPHGRSGHHHHHQHYHHHRHYCNSHYYHHRSRPASRSEVRLGSLLSPDVGGGCPAPTTTITPTTTTSPTTPTTSGSITNANTATIHGKMAVPVSCIGSSSSSSCSSSQQPSLARARRASSTGPVRRCTFAPSVGGVPTAPGLRSEGRRLRRQSSSVALFAEQERPQPRQPVLPPPPPP
ncbi:homeobox protein MOX-2-like [Anopheles ziemanni]|uniref:homeobox protein MOX-2-like n=1 Tax=Anopheles coustani TaxID=139045 RepID=UPI002659FA74|nr:homeobox protein MOX-2-like [Anopheles coustani]XP_058175791.1 homeobox protein MOX-2-like [Anopheles ziemanni]